MDHASTSNPGGESGGTAASWDTTVVSKPKTFLAVAWFSLLLMVFLDCIDSEATVLEELLLSTDARNLSRESVVGADWITELKTPDSLKPWIMAWNIQAAIINQ